MSDLQIITNTGGTAAIDEAALAGFKASMHGSLLTAQDASYDEVRQLWNGMHNKRPALIARCTGVADVQAAVNFSRTHSLLVAVRGGGHNVSGSGSNDGGLMIDLSLMKGVHVDAKARIARVQPGCTLGEMDRETQVFGLATPGGNVSTTGVAGLTLGGGMGHLRRKHGLAIDNVNSVDIVTADGAALTASEHENSDLFWGIRGGGGNFGIVTSFEFRLHPVGPMVTLCAPFYPVDNAGEILLKFVEFMKTAPEDFSGFGLIWTIPAAPGFPEEFHNKRTLILAGVHCGSLEQGAKDIQPLRELGTPMIDLSGPAPYTAAQAGFDGFFPKGARQYYFKSRYLKHMDADTINALLPRAVNPPDPSILIALWLFSGAMQRVPDNATPFMGRQNACLFSVDCIWDDPNKTAEVLAYARSYLAEMEPYSPGGLYVNFAGLGEEGEKLVKEAYGANYPRLVALKNKYDPTNLFRLNQNIKPSG